MTTVFIAELETTVGYFDIKVVVKKNKILVKVSGGGKKAKLKVSELSLISAMKAATIFMSLDDAEARKIALKAMLALAENGMQYFNLESTKAQVDLIFG